MRHFCKDLPTGCLNSLNMNASRSDNFLSPLSQDATGIYQVRMKTASANNDRFVDIRGLAKYLGVTVPVARKGWLAGRFPGTRFGHRILRFHLPTVVAALAKK
jgi:hypothetical protein